MPLSPAVVRFLRYTLVGVSTLTFDLLLLFALVHFGGIPYYVGTPLSFLVAVSINYFVSRKFVFLGTARALDHGYVLFIIIAGGGAVVTTGAVALLVSVGHLYYLFARVLVAGIVGIGNYLLNLFFNFRVAGKH